MRKLLLLLLLVLLLMGTLPLHAQDTQAVVCGQLRDKDCAIIQHAAEVTAALESASLDIKGDITIAELPNTPDIHIAMEGSGAFDINQKAIQKVQAGLLDKTGSPTMTETINLLLDLFKNINAELTLNVSVPGSLLGGSGLFSQLNKNLLLDVKMVDGVAYVNFDGLDDIANGMLASAGFTGWGGIDFVDVSNQLMDENAAMLLLMDGMMRAQPNNREQQAASAAMMARYVKLERTDNGKGDEATFETTLDMEGIFKDDEFLDLMRQQMRGQNPNLSESEREQAITLVQMMFANSEFKAVQRIDIASGHTLYNSYEFNMDFSMFMLMMRERGTPTFSFKLETTFSNFDRATVAAPRGAKIAPSDTVVDILSGRSRR